MAEEATAATPNGVPEEATAATPNGVPEEATAATPNGVAEEANAATLDGTAKEASSAAVAEISEVINNVTQTPSKVRSGKIKAKSSKVSAKLTETAGEGEEPPPPKEEDDTGGETDEEADAEPPEITPEIHEENIAIMSQVLRSFIDLAAEGKLPPKEDKSLFEMKERVDSTADLLDRPEEELEEEVTEDQLLSPEGSLEETLSEEESESASVQEAWLKRQQLLEEFDTVHDEAQRLRIMNMLLHSRVLRAMRRPKRGAATSSVYTSSSASTGAAAGGAPAPATAAGDLAAMAETLEKELLEAGEVRRQLEAEMHRGEAEEDLRRRLSTARQQVAERSAQLQQLQEKLIARMHVSTGRRQDAERMLKRVWPQLLRLRKERLMHTRAKQELESARRQVAELESFGPQRTVTAYEELLADGVKLAEHAQERSEQLAALRSAAERDVQQGAHLREELQGAQLFILEGRRNDARASSFLQRARKEVLKTKRQRDDLYKENTRLTRQMELLARPELLRDHEEVRRRLRAAQSELEKLRVAYVHQERRIAAARRLLQQREQSLQDGGQEQEQDQQSRSFCTLYMDAKCGPSCLDVLLDSART